MNLPAVPDNLEPLDDDALVALIARLEEINVSILILKARVYTELAKRGIHVQLVSFAVWLPAIDAGTVIPETVVVFHQHLSLLRRVAALTPAEQAAYVKEGRTIKVVEKDHAGKWTYRNLALQAIIGNQNLVNQVFGDRHIRTEEEQIAYLTTTAPEWKPGRPVKRGKVTVDRKLGIVKIGRETDTIENVVGALRKAGANW